MKILHIHFNTDLQPWQIPQFRGALSNWVTTHKSEILNQEEQDFFHNHKGKGKQFHYRYPLVQYRSIKGKAAVLVLNEAIPVLQKVLIDLSPPFVLQGETMELSWEVMDLKKHELQMTDAPHCYRLRNWVGLNNERFVEWKETTGLTKKVGILEKAIEGHILAFAIGMDWRIPERFKAELLELQSFKQARYHKVKLNTFDVVFQVPIALPNGIGLGKSPSHGLGF